MEYLCNNVCTKANGTLGFLRRNLSSCPQDIKETAYKGLVWPVLEYASPVWDPQWIVVQEELEKVQNCAARFVTGNYNSETRSNTSILEQLGLESLHKRLFWLCWGLTTRQPLRVILCRLLEKGRKEIEERVEEMKERDREERGTGMKVKKQKK